MIVAEEKSKRPRTRAPVSCLNCKKRKVRCDKGRPCSGCVKNNVGHLCVYVDPKWADTSKKVAENGILENTQNTGQQHDALLADLQHKSEAQEREIQCLRARLAHASSGAQAGGAKPKIKSEAGYINTLESVLRNTHGGNTKSPLVELMLQVSQKHLPITILAKLSGRTRESKPAILNDNFFTMTGFKSNEAKEKPPFISPTSLYSWLNIVKVDPQLTALWFRITSLQKTYHIYKTSLLKNRPSLPAIVPHSEADDAVENSSRAGHKCPVVACEFNLMLEESDSPPSPVPVPVHHSSCPVKAEKLNLHGETRGEDSLEILGSIQSLWAAIVGSTGNSHVLDHAQLTLLVDQYMDETQNSHTNSFGSSHLLRLFRSEILSLFSKSGTQARLEVGPFSPTMSDSEVLSSLRVKALYMSMLAIIIEESLAYSGNGLRISTDASSDIYVRVLDLVNSMFNSRDAVSEFEASMAAFALLIGVLNRLTSFYETSMPSIDVRESFTNVFGILLDYVYKNDGHVLRIWCDPGSVSCETSDSKSQIGLVLCGLWADFLRLVNNATLNLVPILRHSAHIDTLMDRVLVKASVIAASHTHLAFLEKVEKIAPSPQLVSLHASIQIQHLVCQSTILLRSGIKGDVFERSVGLADLSRIISELAKMKEDTKVNCLSQVRRFEASIILQYLSVYFSVVVFLQFEENGEFDFVARLMPMLFDAFIEMAQFMQQKSLEYAETPSSKYMWAVMAENLARVSHLIAGLLIRFKPDTANPDASVLAYTMKSGISATSIKMPLSRKEDVLREADRTVDVFEKMMGETLSRPRTKIWKFYQTFLRNSHKMNSASYAQVHADALGAGRLLDKCPIMSSSNYEVSATRMEIGRCPVFHSSDTGKVHEPRSGACPVAGIGSGFGALMAPRGLKPEPVAETNKCPFGHGTSSGTTESGENSRKRKRPLAESIESLMEEPRRNGSGLLLGRLSKYTPPLCVPTPSPVPLPQAPQLQPIASMAPSTSVDHFSSAPFVDMDWDSLPNFNFDMMEDEALMGQLNSGDFNNPLIEGLFQ